MKSVDSVGLSTQFADELSTTNAGLMSLVKKFALVVFGVFFTLVVLEVAFRVFVPSNDSPADRSFGIRPVVQYPRSTPSGLEFSGPDTSLPVSNTPLFKVAVLGDSISLGTEMHSFDSFPGRLQTIFNLNEQGAKSQVLAYDSHTDQGLLDPDRIGQVLESDRPNLAILQITPRDLYPEADNKFVKSIYYRIWHFSAHPILKHWKSLAFFLRRVARTLADREWTQQFVDAFSNRDIFDRFVSNISSITRSAKESNVPLVVLIFPFIDRQFDQQNPFSALHNQLRHVIKRSRTPFIDLFVRFKGLNPRDLQLIPGEDLRPNEIAHRIASDALYLLLAKQGLLPKELILDIKAGKEVEQDD